MKHNISKYLVLALFGLVPSFSSGQVDDLLSVTVEGKSSQTMSSDAAREIQKNVMEEVLRSQVKNLIGEKRVQKNKTLIENKIIRESSKFIPYLNPGEISKGPDGKYSQTIELKVSLGGVRNAILAMGLGSDSEEPIVILPMIAWNDTVKTATYRWWTSESVKNPTNFIVPFYDRMHRVLAKEFNLQGFPFVFPMGVSGGLLIPDSLRFERPKASDLPDLAEFFNSTVMLKGEVFVRQSSKFSSGIQAQVRLSAIHMERNRLIAESIRKIELENGNDGFLKQKFSDEVGEMARDLSSQISDAWQKGTIGAMLVKLVFKGPHNPKISGEIKNLVLRSSAQVRAIKERLFEPRQLTFEMDFTGSVPELVESLQSQTLQSKPSSFFFL